MSRVILQAPLAGWALPLGEVPDPVFSQGMVGDGLAIDPTGNVLHAPCEGEIISMQGARHAVTVRAAGSIDVLMHVGIDTVKLDGFGFELLVKPGQRVKAGEALLSFDLDYVARNAPSLVTPVLLTTQGNIVRRAARGLVAVGDFLYEIEAPAQGMAKQAAAAAQAAGGASSRHPAEVSRTFVVAFDHGLHARPSAQIVAALRAIAPDAAEVAIVANGKSANARSTTSLMSLGVRRGEAVDVRASGPEAARAVEALASLFQEALHAAPTASAGAAASAAARVLAPAATAPQPATTAPLARVKIVPGSRKIAAVVASRGVAIGRAARFFHEDIHVEEHAADAAEEVRALRYATALVKTRLDDLLARASGEREAILSAHVELIQDPELWRLAEGEVQRGKSAGHAWRHATRATAAALEALGDARMAERVADLRDLEDQVLHALAGKAPGGQTDLPQGAILLADELLPSQLMALDHGRIAGICMARGGPTSHVVIIAASLGIPTLVAGGVEVATIADGVALVLDAERGHLDVEPAAADIANIERELADRKTRNAADLAQANQPCKTTDQVAISVFANLGALAEVSGAVTNGADGCGLLRTEFLFLDRRDAPDEDEQARQYQAIATALQGRPLTIRTLDIGGDKPIPYLPLPREDNPALGLRGLRTSLWKPELLRAQLRAILRVHPSGQCRILLPMVTDLDDVRTVRKVLDDIRVEMELATSPALGVMIETPASALLADQLLREVDFLSVGTNDLSQYVLAMDRGHAELAAKLDALHPGVLRLIATAAKAANAAGKEIAVCGGLASDPVAVPILVGLGIHELSVVPSLVPRIKGVVRGIEASASMELARQALEQTTAPAVRSLVERWQARGTLRLISGE